MASGQQLPIGKKTKKEKRREKKAAAAALSPSPAAASSTPKKRRRDERQDSSGPPPAKAPRMAPSDEAKAAALAAAAEGRRVFVGHLQQSVQEATLRAHFEACGAIAEVDMMLRPNGRFRGSAFLTFRTAKGAKAALKLSGTLLEGKGVVVELSTAAASRAAAPAPAAVAAPRAAPVTSVFVTKLPEEINKKTLRALFRACGDVRRVRMLEPMEGEGRGFVDFGNLTAAAAAVAMDGTDCEGCTISVVYSRKASPGGKVRRSQEARARRRKAREEQRPST
ncbi:hypothetical protein AB1Y20_006193 [Prymnesium parvum]|uniref:RRM domain-containing protein n=1 Tax=Prymnesium parvum TaxID=97485 RepID=A0AB34J1Y6_PRYPA|mmetsp:Transcript_3720/g.7857  ORF Transcript_3720/g.7857 Transcript_3720/m.7857 type:complete len:280 (-) Transcript_3720:162-1001(-)